MVWLGYTEDEKKAHHKEEWDFWKEQLQAQHRINKMSYKRIGAGIIGKQYSLHEKMFYLTGYLEEMQEKEQAEST